MKRYISISNLNLKGLTVCFIQAQALSFFYATSVVKIVSVVDEVRVYFYKSIIILQKTMIAQIYFEIILPGFDREVYMQLLK